MGKPPIYFSGHNLAIWLQLRTFPIHICGLFLKVHVFVFGQLYLALYAVDCVIIEMFLI